LFKNFASAINTYVDKVNELTEKNKRLETENKRLENSVSSKKPAAERRGGSGSKETAGSGGRKAKGAKDHSAGLDPEDLEKLGGGTKGGSTATGRRDGKGDIVTLDSKGGVQTVALLTTEGTAGPNFQFSDNFSVGGYDSDSTVDPSGDEEEEKKEKAAKRTKR
jgi:hypothetical protein